jgi:tRNA(fMet)-specific endonuclease VapC
MICLDTNVVIGVINGRNPILRARLGEHIRSGTSIIPPLIALYEMRYGIERSERRQASRLLLDRFLESGIAVVPFEPADADHAGEIRAHLEQRRTPIGACDYLIAAQARSRGAMLVTANCRELGRVPGLVVADWAA